MQTGGSRRHWLYDPSMVEQVSPIRDALAYEDEYFKEEQTDETTLALILDRLLAALPPECEEALRLTYLAGLSQRSAAKIIGCEHKTVKNRANKGLEILRNRMKDEAWVNSMLQGLVPEGELAEGKLESLPLGDFLNKLGGNNG